MGRNNRNSQIARRLNGSVVKDAHESYVSDVLNIDRYLLQGPDLMNDRFFVEVKHRLVSDDIKGKKNWTGLAHQLNYDSNYPGLKGYWALGHYSLDCEFNELYGITESEEVESHVMSRELYILPWSYAECSNVRRLKYNNLFYVEFPDLDEIDFSLSHAKGEMHFFEKV
ncbi:MAG: hypothetical protein ACI83O_000764 [Patescibacteria group bacterium]|jgi:hypothetical protein